MAYQALYRRFRPRSFSEMAGQEHIIPVLKNQVALGRVSHAYLFCGTRGTGKTSTAKIFARAINCETPVDGEACGKCAACESAQDDVDVIEIDAASNNGVDHIRDLRDKARYTPLHSKFKVYIIDEAHMLSSGAFNALLKTLEEPPAHIVFILATTEPQKLPVTILSRCQRFDFHRISESDIAARLRLVLDETGVQYENEAVSAIARAADGGLRDALSVADQCLSFLSGCITLSGVLDMLGSMDPGFMDGALDAFAANDAPGLLAALEEVARQGRDLLLFTRDFMIRLRALLLVRTCGDGARAILGEPEAYPSIAERAKRFSSEKLLRSIALLQRAEADAKWLAPGRPVLECAFIRLCRPEDEMSLIALEARVAALESGAFTPPVQATPAADIATLPAKHEAESDSPPWESEAPPAAPPSPPAKSKAAANPEPAASNAPSAGALFEKLLELLKKNAINVFMFVRNASGARLDGDTLTLEFPEQFHSRVDSLNLEKNRNAVLAQLNALDPALKIAFVKLSAAVPSDLFAQAVELFGADVVRKIDS